MPERVAFLGMGQMGRGIAASIATKAAAALSGPLLIWNRTPATTKQIESEIGPSTRAVDSLAEIADSADLLWTCVSDEPAVVAVYDDLLAGDVRGRVFVDSSSVPGPVSEGLARRVAEAGAEFVAMPVFGDPGRAGRGELVCLPAGPRTAVERLRPFLDGVTAKRTIALEDAGHGKASLLKLIGNTLILNTMQSVAEALVFTEKAGIGPESMAEVIAAIFPGSPHGIYVGRMLSGEYHRTTEPSPRLQLARDLAGKVLGIAGKLGTSLPAYEVAVGSVAKAQELHDPEGDLTAIYGVIRATSGLPFKNEGGGPTGDAK